MSTFTYFGSTIADEGKLDIEKRIARASPVVGGAAEVFLKDSQDECQVYSVMLLSTLLCRGEAWTLYREQVRKCF